MSTVYYLRGCCNNTKVILGLTYRRMSGEEYRPDIRGPGPGDVVAFGPSSGHREAWWMERPDDVLWLGGEVFGRLQKEAIAARCESWAKLDEYGRNSFDKDGVKKLIGELEVIRTKTGDEFVREGAKRIHKRLKSFIDDRNATLFNIEGP